MFRFGTLIGRKSQGLLLVVKPRDFQINFCHYYRLDYSYEGADQQLRIFWCFYMGSSSGFYYQQQSLHRAKCHGLVLILAYCDIETQNLSERPARFHPLRLQSIICHSWKPFYSNQHRVCFLHQTFHGMQVPKMQNLLIFCNNQTQFCNECRHFTLITIPVNNLLLAETFSIQTLSTIFFSVLHKKIVGLKCEKLHLVVIFQN